MFEFLKKKSAGQPAAAALEAPVKLDPETAIHVMPERFRSQAVKVDSAKNMGLAIIIGGVAFLVIVSGVLYYYLFHKSAPALVDQPVILENAAPSQAVNQPADELIATSSELATLPSGDEIATSTATTTPESAMATTTLSYAFGPDSDNDGLMDKEEIILGTGTSTPDSDADGYLDGAELLNLYDPAGKGKLAENPGIALYENKTFGYSLLYPKIWQWSTNGGDDSVMFNTGENQFIQAIVQPNANSQTLDAWYMDQLELTEIDSADRISGTGWQGIKSPDSLTLYLMDAKGKYIFSLSYNTGGGSEIDYFDIYRMMVKSFMLKS